MNLGNPIQLFLLAVFVGVGAYLGEQQLGGLPGAALGGAAGVIVRIAVGLLVDRLDPWPACRCGNAEEGQFDFVEHTPAHYVWKCRRCGKSYERRRRQWFEVLENDERILTMQQGPLGTWKQVEKD